ncbi:hypothetical protein [Haloarcula salinisoli]|uniref:Uncharacterized protein n=1 Tax=Haloarcula salinisoli TaxID=2487746 RepID=A0A8J7YDR8_9EURY|nr:hypothetical protein [Halomicroarcula salinisoli]MBX0284890.1 hypothetical protein [Halomicroarcula salinisoli]MBX0303632.1 hypothetical protein [Halomicroarcula salinisoli]
MSVNTREPRPNVPEETVESLWLYVTGLLIIVGATLLGGYLSFHEGIFAAYVNQTRVVIESGVVLPCLITFFGATAVIHVALAALGKPSTRTTSSVNFVDAMTTAVGFISGIYAFYSISTRLFLQWAFPEIQAYRYFINSSSTEFILLAVSVALAFGILLYLGLIWVNTVVRIDLLVRRVTTILWRRNRRTKRIGRNY